MDGFNDSFKPDENHTSDGADHLDDSTDADPVADFLAREQNNLAGLEDDLINPVPVNNLAGLEDDMINPVPVITNGTNGIPEESVSPNPTPAPSIVEIPREEPEKIRRWREEQKKRLEKKDEEEERKKKEMREAARKELEEWYKNHEDQVVKNRNANRSAEKELVADTEPMEPGTEWERIAKLCDFNPKGSKHQKDISRMRSIILQVKQAPPVSRISNSTLNNSKHSD